MNTKRSIIALFILILFSNISFGQENTKQNKIVIKGIITDSETNKPIEGVSVEVGKWNKGDKTDIRGRYEIQLPKAGISINDKFKVYVYLNGSYQDSESVFYTSNPMVLNFSLKKREYIRATSNYKTEIYKLRYRNPNGIFQLISPFLSKNNDRAESTISDDLKTITIKDMVDIHNKIREIILQYDVPLKKIWMKVTIIMASENGQEKENFPKDIEKVIKKLNSLFSFEKYEIVGWGDALGLEESTLRFSSASTPNPILGKFGAQAKLSFSEGIIKVEDFHVTMARGSNEITTSLNVRNGETVVVGASRGDMGKGSLITVVTAKVVE